MSKARLLLFALSLGGLPAAAETLRYQVAADARPHRLTLRCDSGRYELQDDATAGRSVIVEPEAVGVRGAAEQDDLLVIDFTSGSCAPVGGIEFDGGVGGYDTLEVLGGNFHSISVVHTGLDSGSIRFVGFQGETAAIRFRGIEPLTIFGTAASMSIDLPDGGNHAILESSGTAGMSKLRSDPVTFEETVFANPSVSLEVRGGTGNDLIELRSVDNNYPSLRFQGFDGNDTVRISNDLSLGADANISGTAELFEVEADITAQGFGNIDFDATSRIVVDDATLSVVNANLDLTANQDTVAITGNFVGIDIVSSTVTTSGTGDVIITGRGGADTLTSDHVGVRVWQDSTIRSTSSAANPGKIAITGTGGTGSSGNHGVLLSHDGVVTSVIGPIEVFGYGGDGTNVLNAGVVLGTSGGAFPGVITSTGTGANAAIIQVFGVGGGGASSGTGTLMRAGSRIESIDGYIVVNGQGGAATGGAAGVRLEDSAEIVSTGTDDAAATITMIGTGGANGVPAPGVVLDTSAVVESASGDIKIIGTAGSALTADTNGVHLLGEALVQSLGTAEGAASILIEGVSGVDGVSAGVYLQAGLVTSSHGPITIDGDAASNAESGRGVRITDAKVTSTGTGNGAATILISGVSSTGSTNGPGIDAGGSGGVESVDGNVQISGISQGSGTSCDGILIANPFGLKVSGDANLTLSGSASNATGATGFGISISGTNAYTTLGTGNVVFDGDGTDAASVAWSSMTVDKTGGTFSIHGTYQGGTLIAEEGPYGVVLLDGGSIGIGTFQHTGVLSLGSPIADDARFTTGFSHTAGPTQLAAGLDSVAFSVGSLELTSGAAITLNGANSTISSIDGGHFDLTIQGAGSLRVNGVVEHLGDGSGPALTVVAPINGVSFGGTFDAASGLSSNSTSATIRFEGDVTLRNGDTGTTLGRVELDGLNLSWFDSIGLHDLFLSGGPVTLTSTQGGDIEMSGLLTGGQSLSINTGGTTRFNHTTGFDSLASLTTDAAGTTEMTGGSIGTSGAQNYNDPVSFDGHLGTEGGDVSFSSDVTITAGASIAVFEGHVQFGGGLALGSNALNVTTDHVVTLGPNTSMESGSALSADAGVDIPSGGTLSGAGSIFSDLTVLSGGSLSPGISGPGRISTKDLDLRAGSTLFLDVNGAVEGQFDQLLALGSVTLGATLNATLGYVPAPGDAIPIIEDLDAGAVAGTFVGLPEDAELSGSGLRITYMGASGNDVELRFPTAVPTVTPTPMPDQVPGPGSRLPALGLLGAAAISLLARRPSRKGVASS